MMEATDELKDTERAEIETSKEETRTEGKDTQEEETKNAEEETKTRLHIAARIVSGIFTPLIVPTITFLILFYFTYLNILPAAYKLTVLVMVYCFTMLIPSVGIFLLHKINGWGVSELRDRRKRFIPYGMALLSYAACLMTMYNMHLPRYMNGIIVSALICIALCTLINMKWKVSTHMASCGMMVGGLLTFSLIFHFNPLGWLSGFILLSGLIGTARIIICQHTMNEVYLGFVVGLICGMTGILYI